MIAVRHALSRGITGPPAAGAAISDLRAVVSLLISILPSWPRLPPHAHKHKQFWSWEATEDAELSFKPLNRADNQLQAVNGLWYLHPHQPLQLLPSL